MVFKRLVWTHGLILSMSLKPSGVEQPECAALYWAVFSLVQVIWTRRWCSALPPPLAARSRSFPSVSSSSSEPMLVRRSIELRSFTSWALCDTNKHKDNLKTFLLLLREWSHPHVWLLCRKEQESLYYIYFKRRRTVATPKLNSKPGFISSAVCTFLIPL